MTRLLAVLILVYTAFALFYRDHSPAFKVEHLPHDYHVLWKVKTRVSQGVDPYFASWNESKYNYSPGLIPFLQALPNNAEAAFYLVRGLYILLWILGIFWGSTWKTRWDLACLMGGLLLSWQGVGITLAMGQAELLGLGLFLIAFRCFDTRPIATAWILALLPIIKLPWVFLWIPFLFRLWVKMPPWALTFRVHVLLASFSGWIVIPLLTSGVEQTFQWYLSWFEVLKHQNPELFTIAANQSLWSRTAPLKGAISGGFFLIPFLCLLTLSSLLLCGLKKIRAWKTFSNDGLAKATPWVLLMQLCNPLAWHWGGAYLPGALFSIRDNDLRKRFPKCFAFLMVILVVSFLFQQKWINGWIFGIPDRGALHSYGIMTIHWLSVIALSVL